MEEPNWEELSADPSPEAIELLSRNPDEIFWKIVAHNPSALPLLQANLDKISLYIFEPDLSDEVVNLILKNHGKLNNTLSFPLTQYFIYQGVDILKTPRLKEFFEYKIQIREKLQELNKISDSIDNEYQLMKFNDAMHQIDNLVCNALK
jgi:hypothetical protein